jgi:hypothetical protein
MAAIILPYKWSQAPQSPVEIDQSSWLCDGLVMVLTEPNLRIDGAISSVRVTSLTNRVGQFGLGAFGRANLTTSTSVVNPTQYAVYTKMRAGTMSAAGTNQILVGRGAGNNGFGMHMDHSNAAYSGACYQSGAFSIIGKPTGGRLVSDTEYSIGFEYNGTNAYAYSDGKQTIGPVAVAAPGTGGTFSIGQNNGGTESNANGHTWYFVGFWKKAKGSDAFKALHENPWQIFKPVRRKIYIEAPAAGTFQSAWARNANTVIQRAL